MTTVLLTGLLSLEMDRLEYGNIGNWYIAAPTLKQLASRYDHVLTTWKISERTLERLELGDKVRVVEMDEVGAIIDTLSGVGDLFLDVQGDLFSDNAQLLKGEALELSLRNTQRAQEASVTTALMASSVGPFARFSNLETKIRKSFVNYDYVSLREPASYQLLSQLGFDLSNAVVRGCPSLLFDETGNGSASTLVRELRNTSGRPVVGIALSGWNVSSTAWDSTSFEADELEPVVELCRSLIDEGFELLVISHSNGFTRSSPHDLTMIDGRDRHLADQIVDKVSPGVMPRRIHSAPNLRPRDMFELIGSLDGLIAGRVHAGMAAAAQSVPVVFVKYSNGPEAHKVDGFAEFASDFPPINLENGISSGDVMRRARELFSGREITKHPRRREMILESARKQFDLK